AERRGAAREAAVTGRGGLRAADEPGSTAPLAPGRPVVVRAPGKVNLALQVSPLGEDGYHRVLSVFQAVSLVEEVEACPADGLSLTVTGPQADAVPTDETNIAWRAAVLVAERAGVDPDVHLHLRKGVPVA